MTLKRKTQIFITVAAILVGLIHLIFPDVKIDAIFITLIILAIIPWLEPLLKSVELPGGLKVEFQDLQKIEVEAKMAGLIKPDIEGSFDDLKNPANSETYSFIEIAEKNQELALVGFRIEIEKRLRSLADKYSIESSKFSISRLIDALNSKEILNNLETKSLKDMIKTLNNAAHGVDYDIRNANWVIENGPKILESLDEKLENRSGRFSIGSEEEKEHWIDKSYRNCKWENNVEWGECIKEHSDMWEKEMENIYQSLLKKVSPIQKEKLIATQENWKEQFRLEKEFLYSFEDLQFKIGSGGLLVSAKNFMNKIRERTLELEEILGRIID